MHYPLTRALAAGLFALAALGAHAAEDTDWDKAKTFAYEQKKEAVADGKKVLSALDKKMAELRRSVKNANAETKAANEKNMADLRMRKKEAEAKLSALGKSTASAWDDTKAGFAKAYQDLKESVQKASSDAKK